MHENKNQTKTNKNASTLVWSCTLLLSHVQIRCRMVKKLHETRHNLDGVHATIRLFNRSTPHSNHYEV